MKVNSMHNVLNSNKILSEGCSKIISKTEVTRWQYLSWMFTCGFVISHQNKGTVTD